MAGTAMAGMEIEFGFAAFDRQGQRIDGEVLSRFLQSTRNHVATLPGGGTRLFLENGGLLYVDVGNHLEWATPESTSPTDIVTYMRSGERLIAKIVSELESIDPCAEVRVWKGNVDYIQTESTWGCHESYLYTSSGAKISEQLVPFLVSRIIFTGSGGLNIASRGIEFSLSPRVAHIRHVVSNSSTCKRGVIHTKNETLNAKGYNRLHVICGESNCSQFQTWLKTGTMMIIMAILDAGKRPGDILKLKQAVRAMRVIAADPACAAMFECKDGKLTSALKIQRFYLEMAEGLLDEPFMPEWAGEICRAWRQTLDALAENPSLLAGKLDWVLKKKLFDRQIDRHPTISGDDIPLWNSVATELDRCLRGRFDSDSRLTSQFVLRKARISGPVGRTIRKLTTELEQHGLAWEQFDSFIKLRFALCEFDMRFSELGQRGIFESLDKAGVLDHRIVPDEECDRAIKRPPAHGRARIRGNCISRLAEENRQGYLCAWDRIVGPTESLNLGDPFESEEHWHDVPGEVPAEERDPNFDLFELPVFSRRQHD